jgi:hypothetical protein
LCRGRSKGACIKRGGVALMVAVVIGNKQRGQDHLMACAGEGTKGGSVNLKRFGFL